MNRREFLKVLGLTTTATVGTSCLEEYHWLGNKPKKIVSPALSPEESVIPGKAVHYTSTCSECPAHCGLLVKVMDGNPVKLEGNPDHPVNHGKLCLRGQAALTRLYHPKRVRAPQAQSGGKWQEITWDEVCKRIAEALAASQQQAGVTNVYLASRTTGHVAEAIGMFCDKLKVTRWPEYEPFAHAALREAYRKLFGRADIPAYKIAKSDFLLTIGADILETFVSPVFYAQQFASAKQDTKWQWTHVEPHLSLTGLKATQRLVAQAGSEVHLLSFLIRQLAKSFKKNLPEEVWQLVPEQPLEKVAALTGIAREKLASLATKLQTAGHPLIIVGGIALAHGSGREAALLGALLQYGLGMLGDTVDFAAAEDYSHVGSMLDMQKLNAMLREKKVGVIFLSRTDPLATLPDSSQFGENLRHATLRVGLGDFLDATMQACDLVLPLSHSLESFGYVASGKHLKSVVQSTLPTLYQTRQEDDILLQLVQKAGEAAASQQIVASRDKAKEFLKQGYVVEESVSVPVELNAEALVAARQDWQVKDTLPTPCTLVAVPSLRSFDGRSHMLQLLEEIPDPLSTISYGQWLSVSREDAAKLKLADGDVVELSGHSMASSLSVFTVKLPVKLQPLLPQGSLSLHINASIFSKMAFDPRCGELVAVWEKAEMRKTGERVALPILGASPYQEGRGILAGSKKSHHTQEDKHGHDHVHRDEKDAKSLYPKHANKDYRWAMAIDLDLCSGCSACVAACYIENNVPLTGAEQHLYGREMSWIRLEPYVSEGGEETVQTQPMLCQHCESAPCEPVCPVFAAYHNEEGLNVQVYNRCVGTRFCANNCPYKVRRFNWFGHNLPSPTDKMVNPDVTVRGRGIMEKCTFCVQRIREAKEIAKDENRLVRDGEMVPACMQTCPNNAIVFGNILDTNSRIYQIIHAEKVHRVLEEFGTEPAVYYLAKKREKKDA
jgi:molybdopterin-containing oxidoreductase family iron-sulfur binding subunit